MGKNYSGFRNSSNWRYRVIKRYKHRAQKFYLESDTFQERDAWKKVVKWFDDILRRRRDTPSGAIGIPKVNLDDVDDETILHSPELMSMYGVDMQPPLYSDEKNKEK